MDTPRILVIEDDPPSRLMLTRGIQRLGYVVESLPDALVAQERIRAAGGAAYDAVIVDLRMPKMDGLEFITWLEVADPSLGCMLLTAQRDDAMRDHRDHPTLLFRMQKPTSFPVIGEALATTVEFTHAHRTARPHAA